MHDADHACVGGVSSADIAVPHHAKQLAFYRAILTTGAEPLWRDDLMSRDGAPIIGLGERTPEYASLPLQWMPHIQVADIAGSVAAAERLGGEVLMHEQDDSGASSWAVLVDPEGAAFGIIPVIPSDQLPPQTNAPKGRIRGLRLISRDPHVATAYYAQVVGWTPDEGDRVASRPEGIVLTNAAGAREARIQPGRTTTEPPAGVWLLGLPVADLDASLRHVAQHGGRIHHVEPDEQGAPVRAIIQDPEHVFLELLKDV